MESTYDGSKQQTLDRLNAAMRDPRESHERWIGQRCAADNPGSVYDDCLLLAPDFAAVVGRLLAAQAEGDEFGPGPASIAECEDRAKLICDAVLEAIG